MVDLTGNITRGPLEKTPGQDRMWRVPHYVKVRVRDSASWVWRGLVVLPTADAATPAAATSASELSLLLPLLVLVGSLVLIISVHV